jgi:hypothetical protein
VIVINLRSVKRGFLYTAIACVAGAALLAIFALMNRHISSDEGLVLGSALLLGLSSSLCLASSAAWTKSRALSSLGIGLAIAAAVTAYVPIWSSDHRDFLWQLPVVLYIVAAAVAYALLLASKQGVGASGREKLSLGIALVSILWLCGMIIDAVLTDVGRPEWQLLGIAAVLTVSMTLITLLFRHLDSIPTGNSKASPALVGRRIATVEDCDVGKILVLDDGRRLLLDPGAKLD